jgi:hypothetical protein
MAARKKRARVHSKTLKVRMSHSGLGCVTTQQRAKPIFSVHPISLDPRKSAKEKSRE